MGAQQTTRRAETGDAAPPRPPARRAVARGRRGAAARPRAAAPWRTSREQLAALVTNACPTGTRRRRARSAGRGCSRRRRLERIRDELLDALDAACGTLGGQARPPADRDRAGRHTPATAEPLRRARHPLRRARQRPAPAARVGLGAGDRGRALVVGGVLFSWRGSSSATTAAACHRRRRADPHDLDQPCARASSHAGPPLHPVAPASRDISTRRGTSSMPTPAAPYFSAAMMTIRPSPDPRL